MPRQSNADIVYAALPEMGASPVQVQRLAQNLPLTMPQVTAALQVLKHSGRAINPRGSRTNYWTRYEAPPVVVEAPEPVEDDPAPEAAPMSDAEARVHEVERHLARIEGALAGMSSRLGEVQEDQRRIAGVVTDAAKDTVDQHFALIALLRALGEEMGCDMGKVLLQAMSYEWQAATASKDLADASQ